MTKLDLDILFENDSLVAINKPAGLVVHADGRTKEPTVTDWVLSRYPEMLEIGEPLRLRSGQADENIIHRPGIVHRLDRETSGVLVIAKTKESFAFLKAKFQSREMKKMYNAFVYGEMKEDDGTIDRPIGRSRKDFRMWSAQRGARGEMREAVTDYAVLARGGGFSYLEVRPQTGRTHQIRVHMKAINHPIVCDSLYAQNHEAALGFGRLALHARSIEFTDSNDELLKIEAPYPEDFVRAQKEIGAELGV